MTIAATHATGSCPARCALAGNPSDGHGGAVVATVIPQLAATVSVVPSDHFSNVSSARPLVEATIEVLRGHLEADLRPVAIDVQTTIPRSVGLAGSSAIVIATVRALVAHHRGAAWADRLAMDPSYLASLALVAERDVLGIPAGLQDRVVQSIGGTVAMEFGEDHSRSIDGLAAGSYRSVGPIPGSLFVAYLPESAGDSGAVHAATDASDPVFLDAMRRSAAAARRAVAAIEAADPVELGRAMDATFDIRASAMPLEATHVEMIEAARSHGAAANYAGSGGAVGVLAPTSDAADRVARRMRSDLGCHTLRVS